MHSVPLTSKVSCSKTKYTHQDVLVKDGLHHSHLDQGGKDIPAKSTLDNPPFLPSRLIIACSSQLAGKTDGCMAKLSHLAFLLEGKIVDP